MRVLIALDQSESSKTCVECLCRHSWPEKTQVHLLTAVLSSPFDRAGEALHAGRQMLRPYGEALSNCANLQVVSEDSREGFAKHVIVDAALASLADLIAVGSHSKKALERLILGSVSQHVVEHAPCPVLIVKDSSAHGKRSFERILVAVDGSPYSQLAFDWLFRQQWHPDTEFCFVHVSPPLSKEFEREEIEQALSDLESQAKAEESLAQEIEKTIIALAPRLAGLKHSIELLRGAPAEQILHCAQGWESDLIVMGSHGRTGLEKAVLGSVSLSVASRCRCSILVVKRLLRAESPVDSRDDYYQDDDRHSVPYTI